MKRFVQVLALSAVLLLGLIPAASAETVVFAEGEWAPFVSESLPNNGATGELVRATMKAVGMDVKYEFFDNWNRSKVLVQKGERAASFPWGKNAEREAFAYFSDPVQRSTEPFFYLKSKLGDWDYTGLDSLKPLKVAGIRGYYHVGVFEKAGIKMDMSSDLTTALKKLKAGRVDVVVENALVGWAAIKKLFPGEEGLFAASKGNLREDDMYVLFSKKYPGGDGLVKKFNEGLAAIKASGEYDRIMGKYLK